ncbi:MAG: TauD/TfdA family dioxygenase [Corynebacterium sp.]|uniref:(3R)-3-[(carboxymethyl)amino]fatty acid oxygenase/decarboxylase n=1 Tax=Corynebacterium sp. TaxID=1720 RepID=UPI0026DC1013|nr:TauD/TfdA family dioxygenase [Corynebacterium sp.]MDO4762648.1 TauD/TfdA family dioxygenase [Corynebacterium sp.]
MALEFTYPENGELGVIIRGFDPKTATEDDYRAMKQAVYDHRLIVLKDQQDIDPGDFVHLGTQMGTVVPYYEPMYHHPDHHEIFVSSNITQDGKQLGVPRTGKFWHSDYQFKPEPFAFTIFAPKILPEGNRGTFFIDMAQAFERLPEQLKVKARGTYAEHSVRRFFKIRPEDVYRPLGEIIDEVEAKSPASVHPTVITHPVTGEEILYISEGFTNQIVDQPGLVQELLEEIGMLDPEFEHPNIQRHPYEPGEIVIWDNRALSHRALHVTHDGPAVSHRVTVVDGLPLSAH